MDIAIYNWVIVAIESSRWESSHPRRSKRRPQKPKNYDAQNVKSFGVIIIDPIYRMAFFPPTTESGHHLTGLTQTKTIPTKTDKARRATLCRSEMSQTYTDLRTLRSSSIHTGHDISQFKTGAINNQPFVCGLKNITLGTK